MIVAFTSGNAAERAALIEEYQSMGAPPGTAEYIVTALREFSLADQLLDVPRTGPATVAEAHRLRAVLHAARGRWTDARTEFARAERLEPAEPPILRALCAGLPFLAVPRGDLAAARDAIAAWTPAVPVVSARPAFAVALRPQLRLYLLGILSSRLGAGDEAMRHAAALERLPVPNGAGPLVAGMAATVRADVLRERGELTEALAVLDRARGEVPLELISVMGLGEEYARYLRAELLYALARDDDALRWMTYGFAVSLASPLQFPLFAPFALRQAQIHERRGNAAVAAHHYSRFLAYWSKPDSALEPLTVQARERLARSAADSIR
ncbi:MAG TPA: hypothetical protein VFZ69_15055 [Longimicrobiales bacterium]